ncbi:hypothetical protein DICPUDRAFT_157859 [Dictyostelium purpureum]|uniref:Uncharacterized protein n=1 Tax=Dictyostelium purpureum TaxID=5786 RepID=F1A065_DICPU|nr:uncharacterized protein DICPUDRAFT_157859 [Dictyostelium purpureum]EGC30412.1 hypothetical protein DICPUDRAFT_157859 [Dictyostelium purpureum]|eukprot:XP_003293057.1 hypothetical protein DICPUDRAFT_157859 [Dictyostelium purpureum]
MSNTRSVLASSNSNLNGNPNSTSSTTTSLSKEEFSRNKIIEEIRDEYERKISAIVFCLQEKSEENTDLN